MAKHTPGPWEKVGDSWVCGSNGKQVVAFHGDVHEPDRTLIAAAPDLLEVAKSMPCPSKLDERGYEVWQRMQDVIRKAEGE